MISDESAAKFSVSALKVANDRLQSRVAELESVIRWALGEEGDFPAREPYKGKYWWRSALRERAALSPQPPKEAK